MKGRKPKLEVVKANEGNRSHASKYDRQPRVEGVGPLEPPDHLTPAEKTLWDHILSSLPAGVLARADTSLLERYVVAWARWRECDRAIKEDGLMVATVNGWVKHPLMATATALSRELQQQGAEMGLSPVARQRLMAGKIDPDDEMSWLMDGTG
jgi:P27 family predicted phage terminase small subunit